MMGVKEFLKQYSILSVSFTFYLKASLIFNFKNLPGHREKYSSLVFVLFVS